MSGSSGHLVVERSKDEAEAQYPGRIFEDRSLDYAEAMQAFVTASAQPGQPEATPEDGAQPSRKAEIRQLRQEEAQLRQERRGIRQRRNQEDTAWKALHQQHQRAEADSRVPALPERRRRRHARQAEADRWKAQRDQRRQTLEQRQQEDEHGRQQRCDLRERMTLLPIVTAWIAPSPTGRG